MSVPLRVLIVEDSESDTALVIRQLVRSGYAVDSERVDTAEDFESALGRGPWDLVISDFNLPQFSAAAALSRFQEVGFDIPFIIVSGTIGEENAVALMKAGAQDYVRKDNLAQLGPVVVRELADARVRREALAAQAAVRAAEARNREILSALSSHIALLDPAGFVVATNEAWDLFARHSGQVNLARTEVGSNYLESCRRNSTPETADAVRGMEEVLRGTSRGFLKEYPCHSPGIRRWFLLSVTPLSGGRGGAVVSHLDVTQKWLSEQAVRDREARLRAILDTAAEGIITFDEAGAVESLNNAAEQTLAYRQAELLGRPVFELFSLPASAPHEFPAAADWLIQAGSRELLGRRKQGQVFPMDLSVSEVRLPDRRIFTAFFRDITERKRVEGALRESEENLARAQEIARVGSYTTDVPACGPFRWSAQMFRIMGRDPELGEPDQEEFVSRHVHPADQERVRKALRTSACTGERYDLEFRIVRPDGRIRHVHSKAEPILGPGGRPVRLAGTFQDITGRKQEEILRRTELETARVLAGAQTLEEAMPQLLRSVAAAMDWKVGEFWELDPATHDMRLAQVWQAGLPELTEFVNQGWMPRVAQLDPLPRRAIATGEALWISGLARYPGFVRKRAAQRAGLESALAFEVTFEGETFGVMVFFSSELVEPDEELRREIGALGGQIGQFIERKRTAEALRQSEANLARAQEIAHVGSYELLVNQPEEARWSDEVYRILGLQTGTPLLSFDRFVREVVHPDDRVRVDLLVAKVVNEASSFEFTCRVVQPEQTVRYVKIMGEPVAIQNGKAIKVVGTLMDITERIELEREALEAREREQRRFGRDLHDGLGQRLTALELFGQALVSDVKQKAPNLLPEVQNLTQQLREAVTEARLLSHGLSPVPLEADGLMRALDELALGIRKMTKLDCRFVAPTPVLLDDVTVATQLYRIAQEAVNNATKHSGATRIRISLGTRQGRTALQIEDNGCGFSGGRRDDTGMGMRVMKYRAEMIGATLEIGPAPRRGLRITCSLWKAL
jgi:PAS domain S-box-containing protein